MKRHQGFLVLTALATAFLFAGCWGSTKSTSLGLTAAPEPARVGSSSCVTTCHAATPDSTTGDVIATTWANSLHLTEGNVQCEDCHGGGGNHWGAGPIPEADPIDGCTACHGTTGFRATAHGNPDALPAALFFQAGAGAEQATYFGAPEFVSGTATPVSRARHIEQCSACHNPSQPFAFNFDGTLSKPNPAALPTPRVGCSGCHNGHDPAVRTAEVVPQRGGTVLYPNLRSYLVDAATGAQTDNLSAGVQLSTIPLLWQPNGAVNPDGSVNFANVVDNNNEIYPERLCASCHAKGAYKASRAETHQADIYTEWKESGHADRSAAAFGEFSANPLFYGFADNSHIAAYPFDMKLTTVGATATAARNAGASNHACFKCHNGIGSLAFQDNVEGTAAAPVIFGDVTVTCITCHDPHKDAAGNTKNTRKPVTMSKYTNALVTFQGNVFFDNTPVPAEAGNETICIFCHQGRESGFTLFKRRINDNTTVTGNFLNPHYLGTGAMLWARNGYEYTDNNAQPKLYGFVSAHQSANCNGCHMASSSVAGTGGHTFNVVSDNGSLNNAPCVACHGADVPNTRAAFGDAFALVDYDLDNTVEGAAKEISGLQDRLLAIMDNNGIAFSDTTYPYFFQKGTANSFTAWTRPTLRAAFNVQYVIKGLPSGASQIGQPNYSAAVHNYRYTIQLLMDSYENVYNATLNPNPALPTPAALLANRPTGTRPATNYDPQAGGAYDPRQGN